MLACGARLISQSWFAPSVFASALWAVFVATALCIAPDYPVSSLSIWLITVLILAVQVGALCGEGAPAKKANLAWVQPRRQIRLLPFVLTFSLLASFGPIYLAIETIREHDLANSIVRFLAVGHLLSVARYSGEQEPILYRAVLTWLYPAAALAGIDFALARVRGRKVASLVVFVPALLVGLFQSEKAPTLIAICLWLGTYLATKGYSKDVKYRLSKKKLAIGIVTFVSAAVCFYVVLDAIKTNEKKDDFVVEADWARVKSSFVGSLSVFSQWADKADTGPMTYGAYTFAGVFATTYQSPYPMALKVTSIQHSEG